MTLQMFAASVFLLANVGGGQVLGFSSILLPQLEEERGQKLDKAEASLIGNLYLHSTCNFYDICVKASISTIGQLVGALASAVSASVIGRRRTILLQCGVSAVAFLAAAFSAGDARLLVASRFLQGVGIASTVGQVYVAEVSPTALRGSLGALGSVGICLGITLVLVMGAVAHWAIVTGLCAVSPLLCVAGFFFCPESPSWLYAHGK